MMGCLIGGRWEGEGGREGGQEVGLRQASYDHSKKLRSVGVAARAMILD